MSKNEAIDALVGGGGVEFVDSLGLWKIVSTNGSEAEIRLDYGDRVEDYNIKLEEK